MEYLALCRQLVFIWWLDVWCEVISTLAVFQGSVIKWLMLYSLLQPCGLLSQLLLGTLKRGGAKSLLYQQHFANDPNRVLWSLDFNPSPYVWGKWDAKKVIHLLKGRELVCRQDSSLNSLSLNLLFSPCHSCNLCLKSSNPALRLGSTGFESTHSRGFLGSDPGSAT